MTDNKTTPEQLVKEWLPEYEQRLSDYTREFVGASNDIGLPYVAEVAFDSICFPEALEAFARHVWDQACKAQREVCAMSVAGESDLVGTRFVAETDDDLRLHIINAISAPTPEFKLTEKE